MEAPSSGCGFRLRAAASIFAVSLAVAAVAMAFIGLPALQDRDDDTVRVGVLPDQDVAALRANIEPLIQYLAEQTGRDFDLLVPEDYQHLVTLFNERGIDLAYFGGLTFVQAQQSSGAVPLIMREADTRFTTSFVVRNETPWNACWQFACDELKDAELTFGSRLSTSGHLMPRYHLQNELGIEPEAFFKGVRYSGAHDQTAMDVLSGAADVGAMNSAILGAMTTDGRIAPNALSLIWETPPYADYVWAVQENIDRRTAIAIRDAFLALNAFDETGKVILDGVRASGFVPASARDFEALVSIARDSGLLARP